MLETFRNAWKIEDLRKRLLFTLLILVLFRLGCALPVPYISAGALTSMFAGGNGDMLEYLNMMSGGALSECTLFALGVQPAINASIIMPVSYTHLASMTLAFSLASPAATLMMTLSSLGICITLL